MTTTLVTGGAGYISSHMTHALLDRGGKVVVLDNLSTGIRSLVPTEAHFVEGDVGDSLLVRRILRTEEVTAVVHLAGSAVVPESVENPFKYYANNTAKTCALLAACMAEGVDEFVFSSTAAVYGLGDGTPAREDSPT